MQNVYFHEIHFYENIWKNLTAFQKQNSKSFSLVPKFYAASHQIPGEEIIILEDLTPSGFRVLPRHAIFDDDHLKLALKAYGELHGISAAYRAHYPEEYHKLTNRMEDALYSIFKTEFFQDCLNLFLNQTMNMMENGDIKTKLIKYVDNYLDILKNSIKYEGKNPVLLHGDCWSSNMMFKYDVSMS